MDTRTLYTIKRTGFGRSRPNLHAIDAEERAESYRLIDADEAFGWHKVITKRYAVRLGIAPTIREACDIAEAEQNDRIARAEAALKDAAQCLQRIREIRAKECSEFTKGMVE